MSEFNLSDRTFDIDKIIPKINHGEGAFIETDDVKEFIKKLKEEIKEGVRKNEILRLDWCIDRIDNLAGDKLI